MKKIPVLFYLAVICLLSAGCGNNDDSVEEQDFLTINGIKKSLVTQGDEPGLALYFNGGGNEVNGQTGNYFSLYTNLIINDPNQVFLGGYEDDTVRNSLKVKFITDIESDNGNLNTIAYKQGVIGSGNVISQLIIDGNTITADAGQTIYYTQTTNKTVVKFSNVHYGTYVVSGKMNINY